jgi:hypothetical protein
MNSLLRAATLATALFSAACGSISPGGDPREVPWNTLWPTPPDPAYWGTWKSGSEDRWLQIEGSGEGFLYRDDNKESQWVKTPLRVVRPTWGSGWDLVTEPGAHYRAQSSGDNWIAVSGPGGEQRFERAALPEEVAAAAPFRQRESGGTPPAFTTDEESDWWWPF